jgi:hypothetical protein
MKFFAVALVRATLPVLRHRHAKVRLVAVKCLAACMVVQDKAKMKGSGTDAIVREECCIMVCYATLCYAVLFFTRTF